MELEPGIGPSIAAAMSLMESSTARSSISRLFIFLLQNIVLGGFVSGASGKVMIPLLSSGKASFTMSTTLVRATAAGVVIINLFPAASGRSAALKTVR